MSSSSSEKVGKLKKEKYGGDFVRNHYCVRVIFCLVFFIIFTAGGVSFAQEIEEDITSPTAGTTSGDLSKGYGGFSNNFDRNSVGVQSQMYLKSGQSKISVLSSSSVRMEGTTTSYVQVGTIGVGFTLQEWDASNSRWVDVINAGEFTKGTSSTISGYKDVGSLKKNYYYRAKVKHWINQNGYVEQLFSYTDYVLVK